MPTCAMMLLTVIGVPLAVLGLVALYKAVAAFVATLQLQPLPSFRKVAPAFALVIPATLVVLALGYGWKTSTPCGGGQASASSAPRQALACLVSDGR